jgi:hypothetical protein
MSDLGLPFPEDAAEHRGSERRQATRYPCQLDLSFFMTANLEGEPRLARVRNISVGGISLLVNGPVEAGTILTVHLENDRHNFSRLIRLRVIYCLERPDGEWILGGSFLQRLTGEELRALLS